MHGLSPVPPLDGANAGAPISVVMNLLAGQQCFDCGVTAIEVLREQVVCLDDLVGAAHELVNLTDGAAQPNALSVASGQDDSDDATRLLQLDLDVPVAEVSARGLECGVEVFRGDGPPVPSIILQDDEPDRKRVGEFEQHLNRDLAALFTALPKLRRELRGDLKHRRCSFRTITSSIGCAILDGFLGYVNTYPET